MDIKQLVFLSILLITLGVFSFTINRLRLYFSFTRPFPLKNLGKRVYTTLIVAIAQSKIFRWPFTGLLHALVFWGFMVITIGSLEMVIDGLAGMERSLAFMGVFYRILIGSGDVFALIILLAILVFLSRRLLTKINRFTGIELKKISKIDALIALSMILLLMVSLLGMNIGYIAMHEGNVKGVYPVSEFLRPYILNSGDDQKVYIFHEINWWAHILLIFLFANILPYSKHFHVFTSVPNVFLSRLEPLGHLPNMPVVEKEVKAMMTGLMPEYSAAPARFGVKDVEDVTWKNYLDSLACTECGRCTAVCPANITGKKLSPRKIFVDLRARMKEKGPGMIRKGKDFTDGKSLLRDYVSEEELWACTTCNACALECPININHPTLILDMRRYLVMEEASAPSELNLMFANIENNGAPWQYSPEDRLKWAEE
jgi:heterodisulfide reductase subunit C/nitrate reductase gamma subunit